MISAVVIEDEKKYLSGFKEMLRTSCPDVKVLGDAGSIKEARELINTIKPDIVFLDINLNDGSAFDLLQLLENDRKKDQFNLRIIFTTASNQFAIQAFRISAIDYLLKPILAVELIEAVKKAEHLKQIEGSNDRYKVLLDNVSKKDEDKKICLSTMNEMRICSVSDIIRCEAEHNYTTFHFSNNKPLMVSKTIKDYEEMLKDQGFERIHQSHLINLSHVKALVRREGGFVKMADGSEIPVARRKKEAVLAKLKHL
jgi:two-component system LytT family response regulator